MKNSETNISSSQKFSASEEDLQQARRIAQQMFTFYDHDHSKAIESYEVAPIMQDVYKFLNLQKNPNQIEVDTLAKVLDINHDGQITYEDIEALCIRYLIGTPATLGTMSGIHVSESDGKMSSGLLLSTSTNNTPSNQAVTQQQSKNTPNFFLNRQ